MSASRPEEWSALRYDETLERAVLGGAIALDLALAYDDRLRAEDFAHPAHAAIWTAIQKTAREDRCTVTTVCAALTAVARLHSVGGQPYVSRLLAYAATDAADYETQVRELAGAALVRRTHTAAQRIAALASSATVRPEELAKRSLEELGTATQRLDQSGAISNDKAIERTWKGINERSESARSGGLPTGIRALDEKINGLRRSQAIFVGGRPGMAKTSFALRVAKSVAKCNAGRVLFWSLEMPHEELVERMLADEGDVLLSSIIRGDFDDAEYDRMCRASQALSLLQDRISWFDQGATIEDIEAGTLREHQRSPLALVIIDHLHHVGWSRGVRDEQQHLSLCAKAAKGLAKKIKAPVMPLAQLNRECEKREDKRPMLSDLMGSSAIEAAADVVVGLYRDEYYHPDSDAKGVAELIVLKQRNGWTGTVRAAFEGQFTRFKDLEGEVY